MLSTTKKKITNNITFTGSESDQAHFLGKYNELPALSNEIMAKLASIKEPFEAKLYVARQCPHCPHFIQTVLPIALSSENIRLNIIDGTIATEQAAADNIMSVPCLILDGFRCSGSKITPSELIDIIINIVVKHDPAGLTTSSLKNILEDGKADWIAQQMVDTNTLFKGFIGLITHEIWSVRLGAMVVLEEIAQQAPELALTIAPELLNLFSKADIPTQGDILYALGMVGDKAVKDSIIRFMDNQQINHADVIEAAEDAIDSIESRL